MRDVVVRVVITERENSACCKGVEEVEVMDTGALLRSWAGIRELSLKEDN